MFIVHDLGSLVVKEALTSPRFDHGEQVNNCTIGIAFFGTPHHPAGDTTFYRNFANVFNTKEGVKADDRFMKEKTSFAASTEDRFDDWLSRKGDGFNITCFFEELPLPNGELVSRPDYSISNLLRARETLAKLI